MYLLKLRIITWGNIKCFGPQNCKVYVPFSFWWPRKILLSLLDGRPPFAAFVWRRWMQKLGMSLIFKARYECRGVPHIPSSDRCISLLSLNCHTSSPQSTMTSCYPSVLQYAFLNSNPQVSWKPENHQSSVYVLAILKNWWLWKSVNKELQCFYDLSKERARTVNHCNPNKLQFL